MDSFERWKQWFHSWPADMPRKGVLVTVMGDQIPYAGFLAGDTMLLVQRQTPDTVGTRFVLLPYDRIDSLKITDVVSQKVFRAAGFEGTLPKA